MKSIKETIAEDAGITVRTLDYYLSGRRNASLRTAINLAKITGTKVKLWRYGKDIQRRRRAIADEISRREDQL